MSMNAGRRSSRIPQPQSLGRRASASAAMESSTKLDAVTLKKLNTSYDAAVGRQLAESSSSSSSSNRPDPLSSSLSAGQRRKISLTRNHSMYERGYDRAESATSNKTIIRQQQTIVERTDTTTRDTSKLSKSSGLNPLSKYNIAYLL